MNVKQLFADEDAVSPVIGVILMVAITVILAAVIGTFVLGLGENVQDSAPQANFQFEYDDGNNAGFADSTDTDSETITITHTGGEDVTLSTISVIVGSTEFSSLGSANQSYTSWGTPVATGSSITFNESQSTAWGPYISSNDDVRVVWTSPSGGSSNTIGQSTIPS